MTSKRILLFNADIYLAVEKRISCQKFKSAVFWQESRKHIFTRFHFPWVFDNWPAWLIWMQNYVLWQQLWLEFPFPFFLSSFFFLTKPGCWSWQEYKLRPVPASLQHIPDGLTRDSDFIIKNNSIRPTFDFNYAIWKWCTNATVKNSLSAVIPSVRASASWLSAMNPPSRRIRLTISLMATVANSRSFAVRTLPVCVDVAEPCVSLCSVLASPQSSENNASESLFP